MCAGDDFHQTLHQVNLARRLIEFNSMLRCLFKTLVAYVWLFEKEKEKTKSELRKSESSLYYFDFCVDIYFFFKNINVCFKDIR